MDEQISHWRRQAARQNLLAMLVEMHRLPPLRAPRLQVCAMPFHPSGSANYSPAAVYTGLFTRPDLARVLGHEASHLMWSAALGADWRRWPRAAALAVEAGKRGFDLEEMMCMHMQFAMSKAAGVTPARFSLAEQWEEGDEKRLLLALEADWSRYLADGERWPTLIDYVLEQALSVLG